MTTLSGFQPNAEAIAGYTPDLVVISDDTNGIAGQLHKLSIPVLVEPPAHNLDRVYTQLLQLGQATGHAEQAASTVPTKKNQVTAIIKSVPTTGRQLTVYHELDPTYYSVTSHIYALLGLHDFADAAPGSNPYPQLSSEYVLSASPDLIVLADTTCCGQNLAALVGAVLAVVGAAYHGVFHNPTADPAATRSFPRSGTPGNVRYSGASLPPPKLR